MAQAPEPVPQDVIEQAFAAPNAPPAANGIAQPAANENAQPAAQPPVANVANAVSVFFVLCFVYLVFCMQSASYPSMRGTSGFAVLRYWVSNLRGIAVLRKKIGGIAVLSFYSAVCGIVIY